MRSTAMRATTRAAAAALAALGVGLAATAQGATVENFEFHEDFSGPVDDSATCLGAGATGTITGSSTVTGQTTDTYDFDDDPGSPPGFHAHGTDQTAYVIQYDDGRSIVCDYVTHFSFNDDPVHTHTATTETVRDIGTLYAADGTVLGTVTVHGVAHVTFSDANGNFEPDPDEVSASLDRIRITCRS